MQNSTGALPRPSFGTPRYRARLNGWAIDPQEVAPPPHAWRQCPCQQDLSLNGCACECHGHKPLPIPLRRRWNGQCTARIIDIVTRDKRTPGELNRERRERVASTRQPKLFESTGRGDKW